MKRILLVGNGAREHVIAETLKRSHQACELFVFATANNPGLRSLAAEVEITDSLSNFDHLKKFAEKINPHFAIIGPDNPIGDGAADALLELGIRSVAPLKSLARLESSKGFTRELVKKYGIPGNPKFKTFTSTDGMREWMEELGEYVVKADGLMGGKGVQLSGEHLATVADGIAYAGSCIELQGQVVIEEKFVGVEFSLMHFVDGKSVIDMPVVQDHKRAFEGDTGPNTGGMGTYSDFNHSLPFLTPKDLSDAHEISVAVNAALLEETGQAFKGIMYGGFMAVKDGVRLIEYNARFGDPEVMNVLPILKTDFIALCESLLDQKLGEMNIEFENKATVVKYLVPEGYPDHPKKGEKIQVDVERLPAGVLMYYASVDQQEDGLTLSSSRALAFVGIGDTLQEAEALAENAVKSVQGPVYHRKDIGTDALIQQRIDFMKKLRA
jgi:phosphoribosylamine--glycine ligase